MVSRGLQMLYLQKFVRNKESNCTANQGRRSQAAALLAVLILIVGIVGGCASTIEFGARPNTNTLVNLSVGQSTEEDIRFALGEPRGHGAARFSQDLITRDIWFYEYVRSDIKSIDVEILMVFLKDCSYDGHFWFSSVDILNPMQ